MRRRRIALVALVALVAAAAAAVAHATGQDPLKLALQRSDMPPTIEPTVLGPAGPRVETQDALRFIGSGLRGADYSYTWPAGGAVNVPALGSTPKRWHVAGEVLVAPSVDAAKKLFANGKAAQTGFFSDFPTDRDVRLNLPSYGQEQLALRGPDAGGPQAMVFVRKGNVLWELRVGHNPAQWTVKAAQVVQLLKTYAAKQQRRVR